MDLLPEIIDFSPRVVALYGHCYKKDGSIKPNVFSIMTPDISLDIKDSMCSIVYEFINTDLFYKQFGLREINIVIFFNENFEISNIFLILNKIDRVNFCIQFTINNDFIVFSPTLFAFDNLVSETIKTRIVKNDFIVSSILYIYTHFKDGYIIIEENGLTHISSYIKYNTPFPFVENITNSPILLSKNIVYVSTNCIFQYNYIAPRCGDLKTVFKIFNNNVICISNKNKVLFGMHKNITTSLEISDINNYYNIKNISYASSTNYLSFGTERDNNSFNYYVIETINYCYLEKLMILVSQQKITVFLVSLIMVLIYGKKHLELINILQRDFIDKHYQIKKF